MVSKMSTGSENRALVEADMAFEKGILGNQSCTWRLAAP